MACCRSTCFYMPPLLQAKCYLSPRSVLLPMCPVCTSLLPQACALGLSSFARYACLGWRPKLHSTETNHIYRDQLFRSVEDLRIGGREELFVQAADGLRHEASSMTKVMLISDAPWEIMRTLMSPSARRPGGDLGVSRMFSPTRQTMALRPAIARRRSFARRQ